MAPRDVVNELFESEAVKTLVTAARGRDEENASVLEHAERSLAVA